MQDLRQKRRLKCKSLREIRELVDKEHKRVKARSAQPGDVPMAGEDPDIFMIETSGTKESTPSKAKKPAGKDIKGATAVQIEIFDDTGKAKPGRKGTLGDINFEYIMWGFSQKVQLAGVPSLNYVGACAVHLHALLTSQPRLCSIASPHT